MPQFDVYRNANPASRGRIPYLLDIQSDLLEPLMTRVVVPLGKPELLSGRIADRLNPVFEIEGRNMVMLTPELAGVPVKVLGQRIESLARQRDTIIAALDLVFTGI
jgi:toxin CcdB